MSFQFFISLLTSAGTLTGMWLAGTKNRWTWIVGLANQVVWAVFIVAFQAWGLIPLSASLVVIYTRNHLRWRADRLAASDA